jgi:hypothetical protein
MKITRERQRLITERDKRIACSKALGLVQGLICGLDCCKDINHEGLKNVLAEVEKLLTEINSR